MNYAHIGLAVSDLKKSKKFYKDALTPLGLPLTKESDTSARFGCDGKTVFYIHTEGTPPSHFHIAFEADTQEQVDNFYKVAISAGGKDNGAPGLRKDYSPTYYAAFVIDPDGHNIEVVCR